MAHDRTNKQLLVRPTGQCQKGLDQALTLYNSLFDYTSINLLQNI